MPLEALPVILAHRFDPADHELVAFFDPFEPDAPGKRQLLLGRIDNLQQVALEPGAGELRDHRIDGFERRQEIADQHQLAGARQRLENRQAGGCCAAIGMLDQLCQPVQRDPPAHRRDSAAEQG